MKDENLTAKITDAAERTSAIDPAGSFIVQAPAGSGKTELLIRRFLVLLSLVEKPEEILAITFTRKAAGEMHTRILDSLLRASRGEEGSSPHEEETLTLARKVLTEDKLRGWGILRNPSRLKVQTIDSICMSLVRMMPLLSRTGTAPAVTDNADEIYKEAARRVTALIEDEGKDGESVRAALRHLDNNVTELERRMVVIFKNRDQWLRHTDKSKELTRESLEGALRKEIEDGIGKVSTLLTAGQLEEIAECGRFASANLLGDGKAGEITALKDLEGAPGTRSSALKIWRGIASLLLKKEKRAAWRSPTPRGVTARIGFPAGKGANEVYKERFIGLLTELQEVQGLLSALDEVRFLPDGRFPEDEWKVLGALLHLMPLSLGKLAGVFTEKGKVDFTSISLSALDALGAEDAPTDLMLQMDLRLKHILVDEYQDTSFVHLGLIRALTSGWNGSDGRTLFVVGDPMQSIYLFREAEVGLFLDAVENGIGDVRLTPLVLRTNFRSSGDIVKWINTTFAEAFPATGDIETGRVSYAEADPFKPPGEGRSITVNLYREYDGEREAGEAIEAIRNIQEANPADTIAVLARGRSHLVHIVELLKRHNVDFQTRDLVPLGTRPVVEDLLAITRALRHPMDRVAWLALLRAPFGGLGLADIHAICSGDNSSPVNVLINDPARLGALSGGGRERVTIFGVKMEEALKLRGRVKERTLVEGLWLSLGGPACLPDGDAASYAESYLDMLGAMEEASTEAIEEAVLKLFTGRSGAGENPVEVMTMHRAKGLEYDHVLLPGLGRKPGNSERSLLLWHEKRDALLLAPIEKRGGKGDGGGAIYEFIRRKKTVKEVNEHVRLLYVAATRARRGLHLFGHARETEDSDISPEKASLLSCVSGILTSDMLLPDSGSGETGREAEAEGNPFEKPPPLTLKRLPRGWLLPEPPAPPEICGPAEDIEGEGESPPVFDWAGEVARHTGTVVHAFFQRIVREGAASWDKERVIEEKSRMGAMLRGLGLAPAEARKATARCAEIVLKAIGDEKGAWVLGGGAGEDEIFSDGTEVSLSGLIGGRIVHRKIDRTFVDSGVRWIIDYKTGTHGGGELEHFLAEEKKRYGPQLEEYRALMSSIDPGREIRTALYYTDPALIRFIEV